MKNKILQLTGFVLLFVGEALFGSDIGSNKSRRKLYDGNNQTNVGCCLFSDLHKKEKKLNQFKDDSSSNKKRSLLKRIKLRLFSLM